MKLFNKIISAFLSFAILFSFCFVISPSAFASYGPSDEYRSDPDCWPDSLIYDPNAVSRFNSWMDNNCVIYDFDFANISALYWSYIDKVTNSAGIGKCSSYAVLQNVCNNWNGEVQRFTPGNLLSLFLQCLNNGSFKVPTARIFFDSELGVYRLYDEMTNLPIVNSSGYFAYYQPPTDEDGNVPATGGDTTGVQWLPHQQAFIDQTCRHFVTKDVLNDMAAYYKGVVIKHDPYYVITTTDPVAGSYLYLSDPDGFPYVNVIDPDSTASGTPNDYYSDEDQTITSNGQLIDIENGIVWFPDGTWYYIDDLVYDESTQTYYVDSHDQYVYDSFNNSFNTTNYFYQYNYYITHTSITYIGQTEEYQDPYQVYYQLPDGRSSADLTAEELEQLSLTFVDVINYARTADDIDMRALYHFDGNLDDSSYWSYCSKFDWVEGASITYLDEGTFEGSLYLDENPHRFDLTLPSSDLSANFTIQFRFYQAYTPAPVLDSSISFGVHTVFYWDGESIYDINQEELAPLPVGNWCEIALVREGDYLYYYLNGVCYGSVQFLGSYGNMISFVFGGEQVSYKKLDELRVTRAALYSGGVDYTPSSVPYDTNLALILPDGEVAIADEYWTLTPSPDNVLSFDFTDPDSIVVNDFSPSGSVLAQQGVTQSSATTYVEDFFSCYGLYTFNGSASVSSIDGGISVKNNGEFSSDTILELYKYGNYYTNIMYSFPLNTLGLCVTLDGYEAKMSASSDSEYQQSPLSSLPAVLSGSSERKTWCLTVVDTDGNSSYLVFNAWFVSGTKRLVISYEDYVFTSFDIYATNVSSSDGLGSAYGVSQSSFNYSRYNASSGGTTSWAFYLPAFFFLVPRSGEASIAYMELVEGNEPDFSLTWHSAVYSSGELEESPVLAVKSNTPISSYQIGGVRPSYPEKGMVWALIENSRITSLQQYTGYAWIAVDGRVWTGSRWIPTSSFDVFTMQDFWDAIGATPSDEYTYIYSESGFWDWWQKQWMSFTGTLWDKLSGGTGGDSAPDPDNDPILDDEDKKEFDPDDYSGIVKLLRRAYSFVSAFFDDFIFEGLNDFFDSLTDPASPVFGLLKLSGLD